LSGTFHRNALRNEKQEQRSFTNDPSKRRPVMRAQIKKRTLRAISFSIAMPLESRKLCLYMALQSVETAKRQANL